MLHNTETLIADLLGSIPTEPNIAAMEKASKMRPRRADRSGTRSRWILTS